MVRQEGETKKGKRSNKVDRRRIESERSPPLCGWETVFVIGFFSFIILVLSRRYECMSRGEARSGITIVRVKGRMIKRIR